MHLALPLLASGAGIALAQTQLDAASFSNVHVPPSCTNGTQPGTDETIVTLPYTYDQVLPIISSFKNLTWSGNPDDTVTLNGTNNQPGTARAYNLAGSDVVETLISYSSPSGGPYEEVHSTAPLTVAALNVTAWIPYDGTVVRSVCGGRATEFNFTAQFCATDAERGASLVHMLHENDALGAGKLLGGANFTSCQALGQSQGAPTSTSAAPASTSTGASSAGLGKDVSAMALVIGVGAAVLSL